MKVTVQKRIENMKHRETLTDDMIRRDAPSVFAEQAIEGASDAYSFIPTIRIVNAMRDNSPLSSAARIAVTTCG